MRWITLLATAAALAPKDDKQLALWLLEPSRTIDEVRAGAETLAARPPTQPCDALALCMASWAASQKQQGDLLPKLAAKLAPRLSEAVDSPRCAEVLSNTARAFAVRDQRLALVDSVWSCSSVPRRYRRASRRKGHGERTQVEAARSDAPDAFQGLFAALEDACRAKRLSVEPRLLDGVGLTKVSHRSVDAGNFAVVSRSFAAAREVGACADDAAPFRGAAPADVSEACLRSLDAHAATERLGALDDFAVYAASDLIDRADADELLRLAEDQWTASAAAGDATNNYRTSETASLRDDASRASKAVDRVAARAAALFGLPRSCCETLQLVRYASPAAFYKPHLDCLEEPGQVLLGGQRVGTVLVYLNDVDEGGATRFPALGLEVAPRELQAVAWANVRADGVPDVRARHEALPTTATKVAVNCWVRAFPGADAL